MKIKHAGRVLRLVLTVTQLQIAHRVRGVSSFTLQQISVLRVVRRTLLDWGAFVWLVHRLVWNARGQWIFALLALRITFWMGESTDVMRRVTAQQLR
jgi:hypothetical protein